MAGANSVEDLRTRFHAVVSAFGLDKYTYQIVQHNYLHNLKNYFVTTYPREWEQHYIKKNYFETDPLVHQYQTNATPFLWGQDSFSESTHEAKKMFMEASDFNLQHGIGVPIPGPNNSFSILTLCSSDLNASEMKEVFSAFYKDLMICSLMFHSSFLGLNLSNELYCRYNLTNRELDCLKWICVGKSNSDMASILGISVNAVKERVKSIYRKMGVYSRAEAIIKAYRYKMVEL